MNNDNHRRHPTIPGAVAVAVLATTLATFFPWASSGEKARSSYAIIDIVDRAGVLPNSSAGLARSWFALPVLAGVALVALARRSPRLGYVVAGSLGAVAVVGGGLVARSPLVVEPGLVVAVTLGLITTALSVTAFVHSMRQET